MSDTAPGPPDWLELADDERVRLRTAPSRNLVLAALTAGFVLLIAMSVFVGAQGDLATGRIVSFVVLALIVALLVGAFLLTHHREYVLTSDRVVAGIGFGSKRVEAVALDRVTDVDVEQSAWQRPVSIGTLRFDCADGGDLRFALVGNPATVYQWTLRFVDLQD